MPQIVNACRNPEWLLGRNTVFFVLPLDFFDKIFYNKTNHVASYRDQHLRGKRI